MSSTQIIIGVGVAAAVIGIAWYFIPCGWCRTHKKDSVVVGAGATQTPTNPPAASTTVTGSSAPAPATRSANVSIGAMA